MSIEPASAAFRGMLIVLMSVVVLALACGPAAAAAGWSPVTKPAAVEGFDGVFDLDGVSCLSGPFCVAVGSYAHSPSAYATSEGVDQIYDGGSWSTAFFPADYTLGLVSCASSSFCMATATTEEGAPFDQVLTFDGSAWSTTTVGSVSIVGLSCVSSSFCMALDQEGYVRAFDGSSWGSATRVVPAGEAVDAVEPLSCASNSFCVAVDGGDGAFVYDGKGWSGPTPIDPEASPGQEGREVDALSCAQDGSCMAVDNEGNATQYSDGSWHAPSLAMHSLLSSVSCTSASFCATVGLLPSDGFPGEEEGEEATTFDGSAWAAPTRVTSEFNGLPYVSCVSEAFCAMVDSTGEVSFYGGSPVGASEPPSGSVPSGASGSPPSSGGGAGGASGGGGGEVNAGIPPAKCAHSKVAFSVFTAYSECFVQHGGVWESQTRVRINGIDVSPEGGTIDIDPDKLTISGSNALIDLGSLAVYEGPLNVKLGSKFKLALSKGPKLKGLPLTGELVLEPFSEGVTVTASAMLGNQEGFNVTGAVSVKLTNEKGLELEKLELAVKELELAKPKGVTIEEAGLKYERTSEGEVWKGAAKVALPDPLPAVGATLTITNGEPSEIGIEVAGINKPIGEIVYLQKLGLEVSWKPVFSATGTLGISAGPKLPIIEAPAVELDTTLGVEFSSPPVLTATGVLTIAGKLELAHAKAVWTVPSKFEMSGEASFSFGPASMRVSGSGRVTPKGFGFLAEGEVSVPKVSGKGIGYISEKGVTGCAAVSAGPLTVYGGFGFYWSGKLELWADNCEMLKFNTAAKFSNSTMRMQSPAVAARASGSTPQRFTIGKGEREALIGARGAGGYPAFTLRSPNGQTITQSGGEQGAVGDGGYRWVQDPEEDGTYVLLARPPAGKWTLTPSAEGAPIDWTGLANGAPPVHIHVRLRRHGRRENLTWRAERAPGQTLRFSELGARSDEEILTTPYSSGSHAFTPVRAGHRETRRIRVEALMNGLLRKELTLGSFTVPAPRPPHAPRRVEIHRHGSVAAVAWSRSPGAASYLIEVSSSDGRRLRQREPAGERRLTVPDVIAPDKLHVTVIALGVEEAHRSGRSAVASWKAASKKTRKAHGRRPQRGAGSLSPAIGVRPAP